MAALYFWSEPVGSMLKPRMLWEIVLNLQILSLALIWFSFEGRFERRQGSSKLRTVLEFVFSLAINALPTFIFLHFTYYAAQSDLPPVHEVTSVASKLAVTFFMFDVTMRLWITHKKHKNRIQLVSFKAAFLKHFIAATWPGWVCMALLGCAAITGHTWYFVAFPFLGYWQGAKEFFDRALKQREVKST